MKTMARVMAWTVSMLLAAAAQAQVNPELGDVGAAEAGGEAEADASLDTSAGAGWSGSTSTDASSDVDEAPSASGDSDHASVVGALGVGFFGVMTLPIMSCADGPACMMPEVTGPAAEVSAPSIGARYWLDEGFGIEAALGIAIVSGSFETTGGPGGTSPISIEPSIFGLALHAGVPLVLAHSGHFAFEMVPYVNVGFASGSLSPPSPAPETSTSGFLLELGGRVGAEIHFGFIDIPQLALQGSVGLGLRLESRGAEQSGNPAQIEQSATSFSTGVGNDPWDIFTGGITAIYYFGM